MEDRVKIFKDYHGETNADLERMMTTYDRYKRAQFIIDNIPAKPSELQVLDYGCGPADYAMLLARNGVKRIAVYDIKLVTDFVKYRAELEGFIFAYLEVEKHQIDFKDYNLVIFGEVLEHVDNPLSILDELIKAKVKYIFTTRYPYFLDRDGGVFWEIFDEKGHKRSAGEQQTGFREKLKANYKEIKNAEKYILWEIK